MMAKIGELEDISGSSVNEPDTILPPTPGENCPTTHTHIHTL